MQNNRWRHVIRQMAPRYSTDGATLFDRWRHVIRQMAPCYSSKYVNKFMFRAICLQELKRSRTQRNVGAKWSIVKGRPEKVSLEATPENCHRVSVTSDGQVVSHSRAVKQKALRDIAVRKPFKPYFNIPRDRQLP